MNQDQKPCDFSDLKLPGETKVETPLFKRTPAKTINGLVAFVLIVASILIVIAMIVPHAIAHHVILFRPIYVGGTEQEARDVQDMVESNNLMEIQKMFDAHHVAIVAPGHEITWDCTDNNSYVPINVDGFSQVFYAWKWDLALQDARWIRIGWDLKACDVNFTESQPPVIEPDGSGTTHWFKAGNFLVTAVIRDDKVDIYISSYEHESGDIGEIEADYLSEKNLPNGRHNGNAMVCPVRLRSTGNAFCSERI